MDSRVPCTTLIFLLLFTVFAINTALAVGVCAAADPSCIASGQANPKWPVCDGRATTQKISFVHIADMHAHYNPVNGQSSPMGRVRGFYEQVKQENPFTLLTDAGDDYEKGSIAEQLSQGRTTREIVQAMQYDVRTLGNHDFAWGMDELLRFSHDSSAVVLATNTKIDRKTPVSPGWADFTILTVGCVRIGFFGMQPRPWNDKDEQYDGPFYPELPELRTDFNFTEIANEIIAKHRHEVDVLVMVSHLGLQGDIALAEQTDGIDLILGGHTHEAMTTPLRVKNTDIVHVGAYAEHIGRFDIEYDLRNRRIADSHFLLVANRDGEIPADRCTEAEVARILRPYQRELDENITGVSQDQDKQAMARIAARAAVATLKIDAAFVGKGTVWREWKQGGLTRQDILNAFAVEREPAGSPGFSSFYRVEVRGKDLLHAQAVAADCYYSGPSSIDPAAVYTVALQKTQAFHQQEFFGRTIGVAPPEPAAEVWQVVVAFALDRGSAGLALDEGFQDLANNNLIAMLSGRSTVSSLKQVVHENL